MLKASSAPATTMRRSITYGRTTSGCMVGSAAHRRRQCGKDSMGLGNGRCWKEAGLDRRDHYRSGPERELGDVAARTKLTNISGPAGRFGPTGLDNPLNSQVQRGGVCVRYWPTETLTAPTFFQRSFGGIQLSHVRDWARRNRGRVSRFGTVRCRHDSRSCTTSKGRKDPQIFYTARSLGIITITKHRCPVSALTLFPSIQQGKVIVAELA